jgi:hypothetical protein
MMCCEHKELDQVAVFEIMPFNKNSKFFVGSRLLRASKLQQQNHNFPNDCFLDYEDCLLRQIRDLSLEASNAIQRELIHDCLISILKK